MLSSAIPSRNSASRWWYVNGRPMRESSASNVKQVAVTKLQEKLLAVKQGEVTDGTLTYEAMRDYLYQDYETHGRKSMFTPRTAPGTLAPCQHSTRSSRATGPRR